MPTSSDRGLKRRRDISADEEEESKEVSSAAAEPRPERVELDSLPELSPIESCDELHEVHKQLVASAFSSHERPPHIDSPHYFRFSTNEECLNFPTDVVATSFKLLASSADGWQFVIHETGGTADAAVLQAPGTPRMHVTIIEFEPVALVIGHLRIRLSMVAYPLIAVHKGFLLEQSSQVRDNPAFKGILTGS
ncbi:hypothetical protein QJQ45_001175 [Haematococcus lacustris]|nr:hypothetical protein QJQ45_001175 [Haematococcus lacustris]